MGWENWQTVYLSSENLSQDYHYVFSESILTEITDESQINGLSLLQKSKTVSYTDNFGRGSQSISISASPSGNDIVSQVVYDAKGLPSKSYLPYVTTSTNNGAFRTAAETENIDYYKGSGYDPDKKIEKTNVPYSEKELENSPLSRNQRQASPGEAWSLTSEHAIISVASSNTHGSVPIWDASGSVPVMTGYYEQDQLLIAETRDENGHSSWVYTEKSGKEILKKTSNGIKDVATFYVYDEVGNLRFILPPECTTVLASNGWVVTEELMALWVTELRYDSQNRVILKKIPEAEPLFTVYDQLGRVVLTQDGNLRRNNQWMFTKYDQEGRSILTGVYTHTSAQDQAGMQLVMNANSVYWEERSSLNFSTWKGYTQNRVFPTDFSRCELLTVNWYDDYDYNNDGTPDETFDNSDANYPNTLAFYRLKNKVTGSAQKVLSGITPELIAQDNASYYAPVTTSGQVVLKGNRIHLMPGFRSMAGQKLSVGTDVTLPATTHTGSNWLNTVSFYDKYGRVIQTQATTFLTANVATDREISNTSYDFVGKVKTSKLSHKTELDTAPILVSKWFDYDHAGRLLKAWQQVGTEPKVLISAFIYNELGQQVEKKLYSEDNGITFLDSVKSKFNVKGFLTAMESSVFKQELFYNTAMNTVVPGLTGAANFNGNISGTRWNRGGTTIQRVYGYTYDALNQLISSDYAKGGTQSLGFEEKGITYDLNGNIKSLSRTDSNGVTIDLLSYSYLGNKISFVADSKTTTTFTGEFTTVLSPGTDLKAVYTTTFNQDQGGFSDVEPYVAGTISRTGSAYTTNATNGIRVMVLAGNAGKNQVGVISSAQPVDEGSTCTVSFRYGDDAGFQLSPKIRMDWLSQAGQLLSNSEQAFEFEELNPWVYSLTFTAPRGARQVKIVLLNGNNTTTYAGKSAYWDDVTLKVKTTHYVYDANGNLTHDRNKGMVVYSNILNLPVKIQFDDGTRIEWVWSATGTKLRETVYNGAVNTRTRTYVNGFEYLYPGSGSASKLDFFGMAEGRVKKLTTAQNGRFYRYDYNIQDHLGNTRATITRNATSFSILVLQKNDYFAFGLKSYGVENDIEKTDYTYNGKEFQKETGWYHYGARFYDPSVGRWWEVDPVDEYHSPYCYVGNNVSNLIDTDGEKSADGHHFFPQEFWVPGKDRNMGFSKEAQLVFDTEGIGKTGPLANQEVHRWGYQSGHKQYNDAVKKLTDDWLAQNGIEPSKMTANQAKKLLNAIATSDDPVIAEFNAKLIPKGSSPKMRIAKFSGKMLGGAFQILQIIDFINAYKTAEKHGVSVWQELTWRLQGTTAEEQIVKVPEA
ncbi:MAG: RHS repeat-associated core domain-containing protein [Bacteroidetes bacterium]|nr:RHS repeat-associated core domain-containing protein [Bacteroidota bacterium]